MTRQLPRFRSLWAVPVLVASLVVTSCGDASDPAPSPRARPDVDRAANPEGSSSAALRPGEARVPEAVDVDDAVPPLRLSVGSRSGYENADGEFILDVVEGDSVYATLLIQDAEGRPVRGVRPTITPERDSRVIPVDGGASVSDDSGWYAFALMGGTMGEERVEIVAGETVGSVLLNVISLRSNEYGWLGDIEGALDWDLLFQADVEWGEDQLTATFPEEVMAKSGQSVKLAGFMMPLEAARKQSHFVLTSSPPGCYFHLPGGPAGAVEVFAKEPLEVGWDPVVLEGRFEAVQTSEIGVIYRLHEARALDPVPPSPGE